MSNIEINDFSPRFDDDFREDVGYMADNINRILSELARRYAGALDDLDRYFGEHRNNFLELFETIISTEVLERRQSLDNVLSDAILASLAVCAKTIRSGNRDSDDWINGELENNPFLREAARSSRRDDRDRDRDRGSRYSSRRNTADYHARRDKPKERRGNRDDSRRSSRRTNNVEVPRGRIAAITSPKPVEERAVHHERENTVTPRKVEPTSLKSGDVVTSANFTAMDKFSFGLAYVAGDEQVVYNGDTLEVEEFTGANDVDYEQHRIDRFYPDILGDGNKTDLTTIALREAEKVKDQTIKRFVSNPQETDVEPTADPKLFRHAKSGSYEEPMRILTHIYHPVDLRNNILEDHGGTVAWFDKNALFVKADQVVTLGEISNDTILGLKNLIATDRVLEMVGELIKLAGKIDPFVWRLIHDYITIGFNKRLVSLDLNITMSSIIADWTEFREWLKNTRPELAETLNHKNGITTGLSVEETEEGTNLIINRNTLYLPIGSYDLDFASATAEQGFAVVNEQTKIFKFINQLMVDGLEILYIATLDGQVMAVRDLSGVMGVRYYISKV